MGTETGKQDGKYSGFCGWWVTKLERMGNVNVKIKEISGNGQYRRYLEPIGELKDDIEAWFNSDFESVEITYDALGIVKEVAL